MVERNLAAAGLDPDQDVGLLAVGVGAQAINAVQQKLVDALSYPVLGLATGRYQMIPSSRTSRTPVCSRDARRFV